MEPKKLLGACGARERALLQEVLPGCPVLLPKKPSALPETGTALPT